MVDLEGSFHGGLQSSSPEMEMDQGALPSLELEEGDGAAREPAVGVSGSSPPAMARAALAWGDMGDAGVDPPLGGMAAAGLYRILLVTTIRRE